MAHWHQSFQILLSLIYFLVNIMLLFSRIAFTYFFSSDALITTYLNTVKVEIFAVNFREFRAKFSKREFKTPQKYLQYFVCT